MRDGSIMLTTFVPCPESLSRNWPPTISGKMLRGVSGSTKIEGES
jgi:hypothetical protein